MKGLSICIPVYNRNICLLIKTLWTQAEKTDVSYEILVADDHSSCEQEKNQQQLEALTHTRYLDMKENVGRARIRNILAEQAKYDILLFMDCDVEVANENYIATYLKNAEETIVVGGCAYHQEKPEKKYLLRWKYGLAAESRTAEERSKEPNKSFSPFNFMIKRDVLLKYKFDESFSKYGHEDTLLGWELKHNGIKIKHIDNPLIHLGIDDTDTFLEKSKYAVENLKKLYDDPKCPDDLIDSINLLRFYKKVKKAHVGWLIYWIGKLTNKFTLYNLRSKHPWIKLFQWYKICYFLEICKK